MMELPTTPGGDTLPRREESSRACRQSAFLTSTSAEDPYRYQVGYGNTFVSEALSGTIPSVQNTPQKCKYGLYPEQLNGTSFVSPRKSLQHVWFYRIMPSMATGRTERVAHTQEIESSFLPNNDNVEFVPTGLCWLPFPIPSEGTPVDFVQGIKTIAGNGDSTTKEGLAIHIYTANVSMNNRAFSSYDGDMLILPQEGRLDIKTEMGKMMVRPGELVVIQAGIKFQVNLPDGPSRGYIQEVFGSHYELPDMGPLGSNGMALPRNFEYPIAAFNEDFSEWNIVVKIAGRLWAIEQSHTPFDVVSWHGNYIPYKYAAEKFINTAVVDRDQSDPTLYTVLTAKSKIPDVAISEVILFTPKWNVSTDTFRLPYYHRNMAAELMGIIYGKYNGTSRDLRPGGLSYQPSFAAHGESYEAFQSASNCALKPERAGEGTLAFMFHISTHVALTKYALDRSGVVQGLAPGLGTSFKPQFFDHADEIRDDLKKADQLPATL
ncbi:homogentisate 1,2-dioxygenase [Biscogniauxia mediterranea]|nr:homogentisate 1,2-dioxygenase [Biscogniauxia mediterranea]